MKETNNLKLKQPGQDDFYNVDDFNTNSDIIDRAIGQIKEDMKNIATDAAGTSYDNSTSELESDNVQDALDEVNEKAKNALDKASANETNISKAQKYKLTQDNGRSIVLSDVSLNSITKAGFYSVTTNVSDTPKNSRAYFHLQIISSTDKWVNQIATSYEDGTMFSRVMKDGVWQQWRKLENDQSYKLTNDNGICKDIPNNNANDITGSGYYRGQNIINAPSNDWYYIESMVHNNSYQVQMATKLHDPTVCFTRYKNTSGWQQWNNLNVLENRNLIKTEKNIYFNDTAIDRDLNNIRQNLITQVTTANGLLNLPSGKSGAAGLLEVIQTYKNNNQLSHTIQKFTDTTKNDTFTRSYNADSSTWSDWREL